MTRTLNNTVIYVGMLISDNTGTYEITRITDKFITAKAVDIDIATGKFIRFGNFTFSHDYVALMNG